MEGEGRQRIAKLSFTLSLSSHKKGRGKPVSDEKETKASKKNSRKGGEKKRDPTSVLGAI